MGGTRTDKEKLNKTLTIIIELLHQHNFINWFIGYGTLLGIIRENSCIHNDDDVDIIIEKNQATNLKKILTENKFTFEIANNNIIKTKPNHDYGSVDFYLASIDNDGNFYDPQENVTWSNCFIPNTDKKFIEYTWNEKLLYLPNNYEDKLNGRYGDNWKIPQNNKGRNPKRRVL